MERAIVEEIPEKIQMKNVSVFRQSSTVADETTRRISGFHFCFSVIRRHGQLHRDSEAKGPVYV